MGEYLFWYRPTRVVPDQRPLNGRRRHISDYHQFSDIHISQGSVATYVRCGGIFQYDFVANLPNLPSVL